MKIKYNQPNLDSHFKFTSPNNVEIIVEKKSILKAIEHTHTVIDKFTEFDVDVFEILGMRNLSSFIGEIFAASIIKHNDLFIKNPHQDGYPDLLLMDEKGKQLWKNLDGKLKEKQPFSPFANGGIEIKATVGSVPSPNEKKGIVKPEIGDQRINVLKGYDWKAHHRDTNNLMGILWDFIDGVPRIVSVFFGGNLEIEDWGKIIQPKVGGGKTTSVSIMTRIGVKKMYDGCIFVIDDKKYINFLNHYNKAELL